MTIEQKEAFIAVDKINEELYAKYIQCIDRMPILSITFAGQYMSIYLIIPSNETCEIPDIYLYNSEDNDRIFYENINEYESFYKYIKRKFIEIKTEIYSIEL